MPRARTKQELLDFADKEFARLQQLLSQFTPEEMDRCQVFPGRSVKDVLAHLYDWQVLLQGWEAQAAMGQKPLMPRQGYTWREIPALNEKLYEESKDLSVEVVLKNLKEGHEQALRKIQDYSAEDLETKGKFTWTGSSNLASYYASTTSSHYVWASELFRKLLKTK
ncbi:MAG: ClbS/DfsB family four-helix bundle protein [Anaerolineaceae bacterium]|nr:ClbS/DfsB family four-helix bundle protein [Anaerolineaceae bacterium]